MPDTRTNPQYWQGLLNTGGSPTMPDTLSTPAFLMLHDADRHYPECRHGRPGAYPADQPCTCGLADEIAAIEAAHLDALTAAARALPGSWADDYVPRAAVLAILRGEQ